MGYSPPRGRSKVETETLPRRGQQQEEGVAGGCSPRFPPGRGGALKGQWEEGAARICQKAPGSSRSPVSRLEVGVSHSGFWGALPAGWGCLEPFAF